MPCRYYTDTEERDMAQREADRTTRYLCGLLTQLERTNGREATRVYLGIIEDHTDGVEDGELQKWWADHKKLDEKRKSREG